MREPKPSPAIDCRTAACACAASDLVLVGSRRPDLRGAGTRRAVWPRLIMTLPSIVWRCAPRVGPAWSFVGRSQPMTGHSADAPGVADARMHEWFRRFPAATESRADDYLISPDLDGVS